MRPRMTARTTTATRRLLLALVLMATSLVVMPSGSAKAQVIDAVQDWNDKIRYWENPNGGALGAVTARFFGPRGWWPNNDMAGTGEWWPQIAPVEGQKVPIRLVAFKADIPEYFEAPVVMDQRFNCAPVSTTETVTLTRTVRDEVSFKFKMSDDYLNSNCNAYAPIGVRAMAAPRASAAPHAAAPQVKPMVRSSPQPLTRQRLNALVQHGQVKPVQ